MVVDEFFDVLSEDLLMEMLDEVDIAQVSFHTNVYILLGPAHIQQSLLDHHAPTCGTGVNTIINLCHFDYDCACNVVNDFKNSHLQEAALGYYYEG